MEHHIVTKDEIRQVPCPACNAGIGEFCKHTGKGAAKKERNGVNHVERMKIAQELDKEEALIPVMVIDYEDTPGPDWYRNPDPVNLSSLKGVDKRGYRF